MQIYEKIKVIRQLNKITQTQLGKSFGLSKATISNFETGRVPVPQYVIILMRLLYNIDPEWLTDDNKDNFSERFYDKDTENSYISKKIFMEKFSQLTPVYQEFIKKNINELLEIQNLNKENARADSL